MRKMVCGLLFSQDGSQVLLIQKLRPEFMRGRLNGIGGGIEEGETPHEAMSREFSEEAGLNLTGWHEFCFLHGEDFEVTFFRLFGPESWLRQAMTMTDEPIIKCKTSEMLSGGHNLMPNLKWLILMALDNNKIMARVEYFSENNVTTGKA